MKNVKIVEFEEKYHQKFKELSYEWLKKYDLLEPEDDRILNNPKKLILDEGGKIFFAKYDNEIVGTLSIVKVDDNTYELAKLGVTEKYQGLSIGKKLMEKCLLTAKEKNAKEIILFTNHKLDSAMKLYKKFGFVQVEFSDNKYIESDIKMKLKL